MTKRSSLRVLSFRTTLLTALALVAGACGGSAEQAPPPQAVPVAAAPAELFEGHWEGMAQITTSIADAPREMDIVAVIADQNSVECGTIEYGAIGCSGVWDCTTSPNGMTLTVRESIRFGMERCPPGANVELTTTNDPNVLNFRYSSTAIQGTGTLNRRRIQ